MGKLVEEKVAGSGVFSKGVLDNIRGYFNYSLAGTWVGTVTLQRSFDGGTSWRDVDTHTANIETYGIEPGAENVRYRFGFATGDYTSGVCTGRIECIEPLRKVR